MLNETLFNAQPMNMGTPFAGDAISDSIIFNGFGFQNANVVTSFKDDQNLPAIDFQSFQAPIVDGGGVLNRRFTMKDITLKGVLKTNTAEELESLIDYFKLKTSGVEGFLDIKINNEYRRTKATCVKNDIFDRRSYDITRCPFEITFRTVEPFFYLRTKQTYFEEGIASDINIDVSYYGTATAFPKIYYFFGVVTDTENISIELNNNKISISELITTNDILIIDCLGKTVELNGVALDYFGSFPEMKYGSNVFDLKIDGTFLCDVSILYPKNFL